MRCLIYAVCLASVIVTSSASAQRPNRPETDKFVPVPREIALPVIVFQPSSPMQFEKVQRLMSVDLRGANTYQVRNRGTKAIRGFTVSYISGIGTGGSWEWRSASGELVMPGQLAPSPLNDEDDRVIPLSEELRKKLELQGPMKTIVFYMVERVEFADGSTYNDESASQALKAYLTDIDEKVYLSTQQPERKRAVSHF